MPEWKFAVRQFRRRSHPGSADVSPAPERPKALQWLVATIAGETPALPGWPRQTHALYRVGMFRQRSLSPGQKDLWTAAASEARRRFGLDERGNLIQSLCSGTEPRRRRRVGPPSLALPAHSKESPDSASKTSNLQMPFGFPAATGMDPLCGMTSLANACHRTRSGDSGAIPRRSKRCVPGPSGSASNPVPFGFFPS